MNAAELQRRRTNFRPIEVKILFVGESPPAGGTFFYNENSILYEHTRLAFDRVFTKKIRGDATFLEFFRSWGCYLEDLSADPINALGEPARRKARQACVPSLTKRLRRAEPKAIVCVMRAIVGDVQAAMTAAALDNTLFYSLPFPAQGHQAEYEAGLVKSLRELVRRGVFAKQA